MSTGAETLNRNQQSTPSASLHKDGCGGGGGGGEEQEDTVVVFSVVIGTPLVKVTLELELAPDSGLPNVALTALANVMVMAIVMVIFMMVVMVMVMVINDD